MSDLPPHQLVVRVSDDPRVVLPAQVEVLRYRQPAQRVTRVVKVTVPAETGDSVIVAGQHNGLFDSTWNRKMLKAIQRPHHAAYCPQTLVKLSLVLVYRANRMFTDYCLATCAQSVFTCT